MCRILRILHVLLEIAIRSGFIGRSRVMEFPEGPDGNKFYVLGTFWAGIIKFYILMADPANKAFL